jgi:hypothetical protein
MELAIGSLLEAIENAERGTEISGDQEGISAAQELEPEPGQPAAAGIPEPGEQLAIDKQKTTNYIIYRCCRYWMDAGLSAISLQFT